MAKDLEQTLSATMITRTSHRIASRLYKRQHHKYLSSIVPQNNSNLPAIPIDFDVSAKIEGEESHICTVNLKPGEILRAESGAMIFMTDGVVMDTKMEGASSAFRRFLTGQNVFLTDYKLEEGSTGTVCLGTDFPSKILKFDLQDHGGAIVCQRGAFLAANGPDINIETEFTKSLSAGFFGGQGFILQRIEGEGQVLVKGGGTIVKRELREGETLRVSSGSIVAFERSVDYDVQMMPGIKNAMFGGEGLFITSLTGPGSVWLQGMPPDRMIAEIARRIPGPGIGFGVPIGGGGGSTDASTEDTGVVDGGEEAFEDGGLASDAAINADRQATVASSGMMGSDDTEHIEPIDSNSPDALFGDAAGGDKPDDATAATEESSFASFDDRNTFDNGPTFDEEVSKDSFDDQFASELPNDKVGDGELFNDSFTSESPVTGEDSGSSSIIQTLWDFFMNNDD